MNDPIPGYVPAAPTDAPPKRTGWPKGKPRKPVPEGAQTTSPFHCQGCARALQPATLELLDELVRMMRDRLLETQVSPTVDVMFLAARLDGYCSLGCWQQHGATETQGKQLERLRGGQ